MRSLTAIAISALALIPVAASSQAADPSPHQVAPASLDGWGPYKFGMTSEQMRAIAGVNWKPLYPGAPSSLISDQFNEFGLLFKALAPNENGQLTRLDFYNVDRKLTPEHCRDNFEIALRAIEQQYGVLTPGNKKLSDDLHFTATTDTIRQVPGSRSSYHDYFEQGPISGFGTALDAPLYLAEAERTFGQHSLVIDMSANDKGCGIDVKFSSEPIIPSAQTIQDDRYYRG